MPSTRAYLLIFIFVSPFVHGSIWFTLFRRVALKAARKIPNGSERTTHRHRTVFTRFIRARRLPFAKLRRAHKNRSVAGHFIENRFVRPGIPGFVGENRLDVASR